MCRNKKKCFVSLTLFLCLVVAVIFICLKLFFGLNSNNSLVGVGSKWKVKMSHTEFDKDVMPY